MPRLVLALFLPFFLIAARQVHAQDAEEAEETEMMEEEGALGAMPTTIELPGLEWTEGPTKFPIGRLAQVDVPQGYRATGAPGTRVLVEVMGNRPDDSLLATLMPSDTVAWFVLFSFDDAGYVRDDESGDLDADALLDALKQANNEANDYRKSHGLPTLQISGWERKPVYNQGTHNLEWAVRATSEGEPVVNFNVRMLGRSGVMSANLVIDPAELEATLPTFRKLLAGFSYTQGNTYGEYRKGDKLAEYGLTGLIAGGALAVAAKSGLLAKLWKFILFGLVAVGAFLKKLFGGKKGGERPTPSRVDTADTTAP